MDAGLCGEISVMTPKSADRWRSWGVSLVFHVAILAILATAVRYSHPDFAEPMVESTIIAVDPVHEQTFAPDLNLVELLGAGGAPESGPRGDDPLGIVPVSSGLNVSLTLGSLTGTGGNGNGTGSGGEGGLMGGGKGLGFFGTEATGESVVFVVDMSGSMEGARFGRAQQELVRAIHKLHVTQQFSVIFFNTRAMPLFFPRSPRALSQATPSMKRSATRWIVERKPSLGTDPREALEMALAFQPEVIYFLTDGVFPEECRTICQEKNQSGTVIHTISFYSPEGAPLLEAIARDHRGTFRMVK